MALTQVPRRRQTRPLHVELLENRCLLTGKHFVLATSLAPAADARLPALVAVPVTPPVAADDWAAPTDNPPDDGGTRAAPGDDTSLTGSDPGLLQGDLGRGASGGIAGTDVVTLTGGDPATADPPPAPSDTLGSDQTPTVRDTLTADTGQITSQAVALMPFQDLTAASFTIIVAGQGSGQGDDTGTGTGGDDSGSTGDSSGTTTGDQTGTGDQTVSDTTGDHTTDNPSGGDTTVTGDPGTETNRTATGSGTDSHGPAVTTGVMGPEPAPPSTANPGTGTASNPPATPKDSRPATPPDLVSPAPQVADDSQRLLATLVQAEGVKNTQKIVAMTEAPAGHGDGIRPADAREASEGTGEKRAEGPKGSFTAEEQAQVGEAEGAIAGSEGPAPAADELVTGPREGQALARDLSAPASVLLASATPVDLSALEKGVHGFFAQLEQVGGQIVSAQDRTGVGPWLAALATAGIALEIARRKLKATPAESDGVDGNPDPAWDWLVPPVDALAPDPG